MPSHYYAAACQTAFDNPADCAGITTHTRRMCNIIEQTIIGCAPAGLDNQPLDSEQIRARIRRMKERLA